MEKIQSAIAKARAARSGQSVPGNGPGANPGGLSAAPKPGPHKPAETSARSAAWQALPAITPDPAQMVRAHILAFEGGSAAVPFNVLRTRLLQQMRANNWRKLAITSPGAGCGKSTLTLNIGFSLGRQPELNTLVAEMDLRRPSLARMLGLRNRNNFVHVLQGTAPLAEHAVRYGPNLAFATNYSAFRNPAELLHSPSVPQALADIEAQYDPDILIFDMPPLLAGDETMAFVGQVDCVLLVAAAESTTIKEIDSCERELASQTNVLGVVLNKCRYMGPDYGYNYYG